MIVYFIQKIIDSGYCLNLIFIRQTSLDDLGKENITLIKGGNNLIRGANMIRKGFDLHITISHEQLERLY